MPKQVYNLIDDCTQYALDVDAGKIDVCKNVKLACRQHLDLFDDCARGLRADEYRYNGEATRNFFDFAGYARHYQGNLRLIGKPFVPLAWQWFWFGNVYGWEVWSESAQRWVWKHNELYLEIPKKNGKTFCSGLGAMYDAAMVESMGAKVFSFASKEEQAKLLFDDCIAFIESSDDYRELFYRVGNFIYVSDSQRTSFIRPLGKDKRGLGADGKNPIAVYGDEIHAHTDDGAMYDIMRRGFSARQRFHMILTTTAGADKFGFCKRYHDAMIRLLKGEERDATRFALMYGIDDADVEHYDDPKVWAKANPSIGSAKELSHFEACMSDIKLRPSSLNMFYIKDLNHWVDNVQAWLSTDRLTGEAVEVDPSKLAGKKCYIGVDLARKRDLSAVAFVFPKQEGLSKPLVRCQFFIDEGTAQSREEKDKVPYGEWIRNGWVLATKGDEINFEEIQDFIETACADFDVLQVNYDPAFAQQMFADMKNKGINTAEFRQNSRAYTDVINAFEIAVESGAVDIAKNDCLLWCLANTQIITFTSGYLFPSKSGTETKRIDGAVASLMAFDGMIKRAAEGSGVSASQIAYLRAKGYEVSDDGKILKVPQK